MLSAATRGTTLLALFAATASLLPPELQLPLYVVSRPCPCDDPALCGVITTLRKRELFGFGANDFKDGAVDWTALTTIAWGGGDIICEAHKHGVRVVAGVSPPLTGKQQDTEEFINATVLSVTKGFWDGVTFDFEGPVNGYHDPINRVYLDVVRKTSLALKAINPHYQVSVCAAWSPFGVDDRWYDYRSLSFAVDFLYLMCYDVRSQIFDQCVASSNAPLPLCKKGVSDYLNIGIPPAKIVLGIPWYGYKYECIGSDFDLRQSKTCSIAQRPFRGVNCSDAAGSEHSYAEVRGIINKGKNSSAIWRDPYLNSPFFNYQDEHMKSYQIWYDDPISLVPVYNLVNEFNLRGAGPYRWDQLDLVQNPQESFQMFAALKTAIVREPQHTELVASTIN